MPEVAGPCNGFRQGETAVAASNEKWFRVCPDNTDSWDAEHGHATNKMFGLSSADQGELSGTRSDKATAEDTFNYLVHGRRRAVKQVRSIEISLLASESMHVHDDSLAIAPAPASPHGHAFLDLRHLPSSGGRPAKREREFYRGKLFDLSRVAIQ